LLVIRGFANANAVSRKSGVVLKVSSEGSTTESNKMGAMYLESSSANGNAPALKFATANIERMQIDSAGLGAFGGTTTAGYSFRVGRNITGAVTAVGVRSDGQIQSDVTSAAVGFSTSLSTAAAAFTVSDVYHYLTSQSTIGASSAITNQYGFYAGANMTGATNNYGLYSAIPSGTNRWNFYAGGTANNYMNGSLLIGSTTDTGAGKLQVTGAIQALGASGFVDTRVGYISSNDGTNGFQIRNLGAGVQGLSFNNYTNSTEYARITSAGRVLIGGTTDDTIGSLQVKTTGNSRAITVLSSAVDSDAGVGLTNDARAWNIAVRGSVSDGLIIRDVTAGADRITCDSAGHTMFGVASAQSFGSTTAAGITLANGTGIRSSTSGAVALFLQRTTSDGAIAQFYRDTTSVGTIGAYTGGMSIDATGILYLTTGGTERTRITSGGQVLIGSGTAGDANTILQTTGGIRVQCGGTTNSNVAMFAGADLNANTLTDAITKIATFATPHYNTASTNISPMQWSSSSTINDLSFGGGSGNHNSSTQIRFFAGATQTTLTGTEKARITANGLGVGLAPTARNNTSLQVVDGIGFPVTQVASSDANTLDDYEEGTFTPTMYGTTTAGTGTYTLQSGTYNKTGNTVYFTANMTTTAHTGTGNVRFGGLPFTVGNTSSSQGSLTIGYINNLTLTAGYVPMAYSIQNTTNIDFNAVNAGAAAPIAMDTAFTIFMSGHYTV
jgi:hypothetical protein